MKEIFAPDSPFMVSLRRFCNLALLNVMWAVACMPVFTIGASTVCMYRTIAELRKEKDEGYEGLSPAGFFVRSFFQEFRQSTLLFVCKVLIAALLLADFRIAYMFQGSLSTAIKVICWIPTVLLLLVNGFVYPLQAKFSNSVFQTLKNAALMAFANPSVAISVALLNAIPLILLLKLPDLFVMCLFAWFVIGTSLIAWVNWMMLLPVFNKYINEENAQ